jgi:hypothetical protein
MNQKNNQLTFMKIINKIKINLEIKKIQMTNKI